MIVTLTVCVVTHIVCVYVGGGSGGGCKTVAEVETIARSQKQIFRFPILFFIAIFDRIYLQDFSDIKSNSAYKQK